MIPLPVIIAIVVFMVLLVVCVVVLAWLSDEMSQIDDIIKEELD